jgi:leucyl/phenylalanyl-tRNA--protein transferase
MATAHLRSLGARELPRDEFLRRLREAIRAPGVAAPWRFDADVVNGGDPGACSTV